jgi:hypothetical protein
MGLWTALRSNLPISSSGCVSDAADNIAANQIYSPCEVLRQSGDCGVKPYPQTPLVVGGDGPTGPSAITSIKMEV